MRPARCHLQGSGPHKAVKYRLLRNESERKKKTTNLLTKKERTSSMWGPCCGRGARFAANVANVASENFL